MEEPYVDKKGLMFCGPHRREVCYVCCVDHRITNDMIREGPDADLDAIMARNQRAQEAEHAAMAAAAAARGRREVVLGSEEAAGLYQAVAAPARQSACARCAQRGDRLLLCARCKAVKYCGRECQVADYPRHKQACRAAAAAAAAGGAPPSGAGGAAAASSAAGGSGSEPRRRDLVGWEQLEALGDLPAESKTLELRILSEPVPFLRHICEGKDHRGAVRRLAFQPDSAPAGLKLGAVLRWRNPRYHFFMDGSAGARIEDEDLSNLTVVRGA